MKNNARKINYWRGHHHNENSWGCCARFLI